MFLTWSVSSESYPGDEYIMGSRKLQGIVFMNISFASHVFSHIQWFRVRMKSVFFLLKKSGSVISEITIEHLQMLL